MSSYGRNPVFLSRLDFLAYSPLLAQGRCLIMMTLIKQSNTDRENGVLNCENKIYIYIWLLLLDAFGTATGTGSAEWEEGH